jgi:hypothetical protein
MPLEKRFQGELITRTKRCGNRILVRVRFSDGTATRSRWLALSPHEYSRGTTCNYRLPEEGRPRI